MTLLGLLAGGGAVVVALRRRSPRLPVARATQPMPLPSPRPEWRAARTESDTLAIAVDAMTHHTQMLRSIADAWLLSANLWESDPAAFRRKMQHAETMAMALEDECIEVIDALRALERMRDSAAAFALQRDQATALAEQAEAATTQLRAQVQRLADARGMEARAPYQASASSVPSIDLAQVARLMPLTADAHPLPLQELLG
ncbi:hypothetical protein SAMN02800691_0732 [Luteibacter sp. UNCMF366Tsu5.1]|nr:hypothetical protein SAMN02800691_0732 [Luteibacter sp. UNCMF366Tsu5.1]